MSVIMQKNGLNFKGGYYGFNYTSVSKEVC